MCEINKIPSSNLAVFMLPALYTKFIHFNLVKHECNDDEKFFVICIDFIIVEHKKSTY